jgi:hypothetical protein
MEIFEWGVIMRINKLIAIILSLVLFFSVFQFAVAYALPVGTTYYVDSINGSDENSGKSKSSAFKSVSKASSIEYQPGDSILFKNDCIFIGTFTAHGSGTKENPITVDSYGDSTSTKPIIQTEEQSTAPAFEILDESYWTVSNLEITSKQGTGIFVHTANKISYGVVLRNLTLHDIQNYPSDTYNSGSRAAIRLLGSTVSNRAHLEDITVDGCTVYDCSYGIYLNSNYPETEETPYNKNVVVENCSLSNLYDDAFIMGQTNYATMRNCTVIKACQSSGLYYTAPVWMWGISHGVVENCEIAEAKNALDGMAVDFDDHTDNSVYQYVYSHDNTRFMVNCPYIDDHYNNTVRYCLSVNDNRAANNSGYYGRPEYNFKFYNNTIINGTTFNFRRYKDSVIQNNIFSLVPGEQFILSKDYSYTISNNCYLGTLQIKGDKKYYIGLPQFAGKDETDKDSFILKKCSPLIGAGVQVEEDMGKTDFYGNALTSTHNIGCYEGEGVDGKYERLSPFRVMGDVFKGFASYIKAEFIHIVGWVQKQINKIGKNG